MVALALRVGLLAVLVVFFTTKLVTDSSPVAAVIGIAAAFVAGFYAIKRYRRP
jgi:putative flippase GtrA